MKKQMVTMIGIFLLILAIFTGAFAWYLAQNMSQYNAGESIVLLNEIRQLTNDSQGNNPAKEQIEELNKQLKSNMAEVNNDYIWQLILVYLAFSVSYVVIVSVYIYRKILRPFQTLEVYASQIAKGNFDVALSYERTNFFGAFTWAFDHMREEIKTARRNEITAVEENKTVIATLSHDIKTPVASIRAYAEGLEANLDSTFEKRHRYVQVIMNKCHEITALTNDLVLHSLSELNRLEVKNELTSMKEVMEGTMRDLLYPYVSLQHPVPDATLMIDRKRMAQVLENLLNNARKYAPDKPIVVWATKNETHYEIHVRDHGNGILPEDMPFIFHQFYRGKNVGNQQGSGLGLYIAKYLMRQMNGDIDLINHEDGLEVIIWLNS